MGSSKKATVGYQYYMGLHFGLCHGPVDSLIEIIIGERSAWNGDQTVSGATAVFAPQLFGGDEREGGVGGQLDVMMGEATQPQNDYLVSKLGANVPAFRGILSAVFRQGYIAANNPYVKPWSFRVRRILEGWSGGTAWYPEKAEIGISTEIIGGQWQYEVIPFHADPGNQQLTPPGTWQGETSLPLVIGSSIWPHLTEEGDPILSICWVKKTLYNVPAGLIIQLRADNGCVLWANGDYVGASNIDNADIPNNQNNPVNFIVPETGTYEIIGKAYSESLEASQGGNYLNVTIESTEQIAMNPGHIIYQCLTDTSWGMGYPTTSIDNASFTAAANTLFDEGFGLSMLWSRQETIENFIQIILDHIGGLLYVKPDTGRFALKLIRSDYDRGTLTLYGTDTLIAAENYQRQSWGETVNEITVIYTDRTSGKDTTVTVQDMANVQIQGGVVSQTRNYPGISLVGLAQRVALRDLQTMSTPLARIKLTATRAAWQVFPGDVFRLSWPEYGIDDVVYRALSVNRGTLQDGQIIIDAVEDVFGLPDNTYLVEQPSEWEDPSNAPAPAPYRKLLEAPYWDLVRNLSAADLDYVDALSGYLETLAVRPSGDATNYSIWAKIGATDYAEEGDGDFCASATIAETLTKITTAITLENGVDLDIVIAGGYAVIENEYVLVSAIDPIALTATISRGVLDTVPVAHAANARIWFADNYTGFSTTEFADGEVLDVKLLPITGQGELDIVVAPSDSITFDQRQYRPYPPANVLFDGAAWPALLTSGDDIVLTWAHRDRTLQTAYIVEQSEASIGPEAGVTYSIEVADEALTVLHSATGISTTTETVPATSLTYGVLRFRLWSVRGGLISWNIHEHFAHWGEIEMITEDGEARITEDDELIITE